MAKVKSHEERKILLKGESLRENPKTILLSIPVFGVGYIYYLLVGDKQGVAGALGHCGITFKNYYRHHWHKEFLLKISFTLFLKSTDYAKGEGRVSTLLHAAQSACDLGNLDEADELYNDALKEADAIEHTAIKGNIYSHMAANEMKRENFKKAKKYLDDSYNILLKAEKDKSKSMYIQVWISGTEMSYGWYHLTLGDKKCAKSWALKAKKRVNKYDLKTRKADVEKLFKKIG